MCRPKRGDLISLAKENNFVHDSVCAIRVELHLERHLASRGAYAVRDDPLVDLLLKGKKTAPPTKGGGLGMPLEGAAVPVLTTKVSVRRLEYVRD